MPESRRATAHRCSFRVPLAVLVAVLCGPTNRHSRRWPPGPCRVNTRWGVC